MFTLLLNFLLSVIPATGPDSDVEVVEARSGRIREPTKAKFVEAKSYAVPVATPVTAQVQRFVAAPRVNLAYPAYTASYTSFASPVAGYNYVI